MPEYDFDAVIPKDVNRREAFIKVELKDFEKKHQAEHSFANGALKISATVDNKVYSTTIDGLTGEHVKVTGIENSEGFFRVCLQIIQDGFKVSSVFPGN